MISVHERATAAGLLMGEGCIQIATYRQRRQLRLTIAMNDAAVVKWIHERWGGYFGRRRTGTYEWTVASRQAARFLADVSPYVFGDKLPQLALALNFQSQKQHGGRRLSTLQREFETWAAGKMKALKPRGAAC